MRPLRSARRVPSGALRRYVEEIATNPASVVVRFRPGCAQAFFRFPMRELVDHVVPLEELWADEGIRIRETLAAANAGQWLQLFEAALQRRMRLLDVEPDSVRAASAAMATIRSCAEPECASLQTSSV